MNEKLSDPQTLFEILEKYDVVIPIIQRDYAQGRANKSSEIVRNTLLTDMKKAVSPDATSPLDLGFVYGKVENNKFIPIDGQQRLTTLFLLHLFAFRDDDSKTGLLQKFTYKTRPSSRIFLKNLVDKDRRKAAFSSNLKPSEEIKDSEWFVTSWRLDPTIQSMLNMLDAIKRTFGDVPNLDRSLSDSKSFTFKFLKMDDLGMEDSLYIKLNARGRPLTAFENFKARLIGRLIELPQKQPLPFTCDKFERRLDRNWIELFWKKAKANFDQVFLAFFGEILLNKGICEDNSNDWVDLINYENIGKEYYETIYFTLNFLCQQPECHQIHDLVFRNLGNKERTFRDKTMFHAVSSYLYRASGCVNDVDSLKQWIRIINNLTFNTQIRAETYRQVVDSINELSEHWNDLLGYFGKSDKILCKGFSAEQLEEERIKAHIILDDASFANALFEAEKHPYFNGQVRSALYLSEQNGNYDRETFVNYWTKISSLFEDDKPRNGDNQYLLRRTLLTFGDYRIPVESYHTFCVNSPSYETTSLKYLFSYDKHNRRQIIKELLDRLDVYDNPSESVPQQLQEIINQSPVPKNDWRYCFIRFPKLFGRMSPTYMRLREGHEHRLMIVANYRSSGLNYDVFLAALHESLNEHCIKSKFENHKGTWVDSFLTIKNYRVRFRNSKFIIQDENKTTVETGIDDPLGDALSRLMS